MSQVSARDAIVKAWREQAMKSRCPAGPSVALGRLGPEELRPGDFVGTTVVLGATDTGKSTFARWLVGELCGMGQPVGWLDADVGQGTLGPPTTVSLAVASRNPARIPKPRATFFVGAPSPRGHMLPLLVGVERLRERAGELGARSLVVDTTGFVDLVGGGGALKQWKIELLRPRTVVAFARGDELDHLLAPLGRDPAVRVLVLPVSPRVRCRSPEQRAERRRQRYRRALRGAEPVRLSTKGLPVWGLELARPGRLLALQDAKGFTLCLGVLEAVLPGGALLVRTRPRAVRRAASVRLGSVCLDPATGHELRLWEPERASASST